MSETRLGTDVFVALPAIGGVETDAIVRAAFAEGRRLEKIGAIEEPTVSPVDVGVIQHFDLAGLRRRGEPLRRAQDARQSPT